MSEACERCQGAGEIVTDWDRYLSPLAGDIGDEAVEDCPDCGGSTPECPKCHASAEQWWSFCAMCGYHIAANNEAQL